MIGPSDLRQRHIVKPPFAAIHPAICKTALQPADGFSA
jgi:hypothetical protein